MPATDGMQTLKSSEMQKRARESGKLHGMVKQNLCFCVFAWKCCTNKDEGNGSTGGGEPASVPNRDSKCICLRLCHNRKD